MIDRIGAVLFGTNEWKRPLARALDVSPRRVQRWAAGDETIPDSVLRELFEMLRQRDVESASIRWSLMKEIYPDD